MPALIGAGEAFAAPPADPAAALERSVQAAEASLRSGKPEAAEGHYQAALLEGWLLAGTLERIEGRLPAAREAFRSAVSAAADDRRALLPLALVDLQLGEVSAAIETLRGLAGRNPGDVEARRLLSRALEASGQPEAALRELEGARQAAPGDLELAFDLAGAYLQRKDVERAGPLFAEIKRARPIPQTRVLIGRSYLEAGQTDHARRELLGALDQDPRAAHAHYFLGQLALREKQADGLQQAIAEFRTELRAVPDDPLANRELGVALVETQHPEQALAPLEIASRAPPPQARTFYYLGRSQLALDRPEQAAESLKRALELAREQGAAPPVLRAIHMPLGQALRRLGSEDAAAHFAEAERLSAAGADQEREQLARYLADVPEAAAAQTPVVPIIEDSPLVAWSPAQRAELRRRVSAALARSYLNLGVMQVHVQQFERAAELLEHAAAIDPDFPQLQSSLGVAYFNARQFEKAAAPLARALSANPDDAGLKRMLAMAKLNTDRYEEAARLLKEDPQLDSNPSLLFAYGLALVKSERAAEAEIVFSRLLAQHGDSAELSVLLGQAHAQQGDYDSAVAALQRALQLKADVAEANATLGEIYLRQGRFEEAETALRAELKHHPDDLSSQQHLAIVLDSQQRSEEAVPLLRGILRAKPALADAHYLLGKILVTQGSAAEAVEHLEAAARLSPEDASIPYQLGRAYQSLGRTDEAEQQFERFRQLKAKR